MIFNDGGNFNLLLIPCTSYNIWFTDGIKAVFTEWMCESTWLHSFGQLKPVLCITGRCKNERLPPLLAQRTALWIPCTLTAFFTEIGLVTQKLLAGFYGMISSPQLLLAPCNSGGMFLWTEIHHTILEMLRKARLKKNTFNLSLGDHSVLVFIKVNHEKQRKLNQQIYFNK